MKTLRLALGALALAVGSMVAVCGQEQEIQPAPAQLVLAPLTPAQLEQLVGPIALYPDPLIALILPASTVPTDIVLAARHLRDSNNDLSTVEGRAWDDSVKSLAHYPDVLKWMDENLNWTKQLGEQFALQPAEVMKAVQRLRARAKTNGTLTDTPQQQVLTEAATIRIVPAEQDVIYVPYYDPQVVFVDRPVYYSQPLISFGAGWRVGSWLAYDFDWHRCHLWVGDRHRRWHIHHDWRRPIVPVAQVHVSHYTSHRPTRQWSPPSRSYRPGFSPGPRSTTTTTSVAADLPVAPPLRMATSTSSRTSTPQPAPNRTFRSSDSRRPSSTAAVSAAPEPAASAPTPAPRLSYSGNAPIMGPTVAPAAAAPAPAPALRIRNAAPERSNPTPRTFESRSRPSQSHVTSAPLPSAPPLQMASPPPSRSYPSVSAAPSPRAYSPPARHEAPAVQSNPAPSHPAPAPAPAPRASQSDSDRRGATRSTETER